MFYNHMSHNLCELFYPESSFQTMYMYTMVQYVQELQIFHCC